MEIRNDKQCLFASLSFVNNYRFAIAILGIDSESL
jgi:hypothetical protein